MKQEHRDPLTGDILTSGEWMSWKIQGIIRNWFFLILITLVTLLVWLTNNPTALTWWNLGASYLALVIESIVGIAMFSQTRRDAIILRRIAEMEKSHELMLTRLNELGEQNLEQLRRIDLLLEKRKRGRPRKHPVVDTSTPAVVTTSTLGEALHKIYLDLPDTTLLF